MVAKWTAGQSSNSVFLFSLRTGVKVLGGEGEEENGPNHCVSVHRNL